MQRLVVDTDVVVAGMRSPRGASAALLMAARNGAVTLLCSLPLALEYQATCLRLEHREAAGLSEQETRQFLDAIIGLMEPVEIYYLWRPLLHDPNDEMVLEAAINGNAEGIVTFNRKDYRDVPEALSVTIYNPAEALRSIEQ